MSDDRRDPQQDDQRADEHVERRARIRGGRRTEDSKQPWYFRHRLWLAVASVAFVGWRRLLGRKTSV